MKAGYNHVFDHLDMTLLSANGCRCKEVTHKLYKLMNNTVQTSFKNLHKQTSNDQYMRHYMKLVVQVFQFQ